MFDLEDFVRESNRIENIHREPTRQEIDAHKQFLLWDSITVKNLEYFVSGVQPGAVLRRETGMNVRVGNHRPPYGGIHIEYALKNILESYRQGYPDSAYEQHHDYETLHPFTDGNGRSGRALWLWAMNGRAPLGFLHEFYYQALSNKR